MLDAEGNVEVWFGTATDIHERKLAEEALRRAKEAAEAAESRSAFLAEVGAAVAAGPGTGRMCDQRLARA